MTKRFTVKDHTDNDGNECWLIFDTELGYNLYEVYTNKDWAEEDADKMERGMI